LKNIRKSLFYKMFPSQNSVIFPLKFEKATHTWEQDLLGNLVNIFSGEFVNQIYQNDSFKFPVYNGGTENTGFYKKFNQKGNKIIISGRGANAGFINFVNQPFWAGNSVYSLSFDTGDLLFYFYNLKLNQINLMRKVNAANIPSILKTHITDLKLSITTKNKEQSKIADLFTYLDSVLSLHKHKF
ncbi:restriction endonuclease subunit S, partial [Mycoplasma sp. 613B]